MEKDNFRLRLNQIIDNVLLVNLFLVIIFAIVFIFSIIMNSSGVPFFLRIFRKMWNPIVVPLITILITGALLNGITSWLKKKLHYEAEDT